MDKKADDLNVVIIKYTEPDEILQAAKRVKLQLSSFIQCQVVNTVATIIIKSVSEYRIPFTIMDISYVNNTRPYIIL